MIKAKLESLDEKFITPRTGKTLVHGEINIIPTDGKRLVCMYVDEECESPGVFIHTYCVEQIGNEIKFFDHDKRPFKITLL